MDEDHYECAVCGATVFMGDLGAVMLHEHRGITDRVDLSKIAPGVWVEPKDEAKPKDDPE